MIKAILILLFAALSSVGIPSPYGAGEELFPVPTEKPTKPSGPFCITKDELEEIKSRPVAFTCDRTNIDRTKVVEPDVSWVLAAQDVVAKKVYIHPQKQLILKEVCGGINYYTWKCHPPSWGSIYANTMWKLRGPDPNRTPLENGDHFDVYVRKDAKPEGFWICKDKTKAKTADYFRALGIKTQADPANPLEGKTITVNGKNAIWRRRGDAQKLDIKNAPPREKIDTIKVKDKDYDVFVNLLKAFSPDKDAYFYLVEKDSLPENDLNLPDIIYYDAFQIVYETIPGGKTLQLGTFNPLPPKNPWYDAYLPESKPVLYLYPEEPTALNIKILPKNGRVTVSEPLYNPETGWSVIAYPSGEIKEIPGNKTSTATSPDFTPKKFLLLEALKTYKYLYYETEVAGYKIPERGFVIKNNPKELGDYFNRTLPLLGLNKKEIADYNKYWIHRLTRDVKTPYIFTTYISQEQQDKVVPLAITAESQKTNLIRVRSYFRPLSSPFTPKPLLFPKTPPEREGFTAVEWGGILDK